MLSFYKHKLGYSKGFTMLEIMIAIAIMVILAAAVIVSINPQDQVLSARNRQREAHVNAIYLALVEYKSREGEFPACVPEDPSSDDVYECEADLVDEYIASLPIDPGQCAYDTGYFVKKDPTTNVLGVRAECAEDGAEIVVGTWE